VALGERPVELSYNLALALQAAGENEAAAECYRIALQTKPDFSDALVNLGHTLMAAGKEEEARQLWGQAVIADPDLASKYFQ